MNATIYSSPSCGYCVAAKNKLASLGIEYLDIDVSTNAAAREEMKKKTGRFTVPQIFIDGNHVGGFDDLIRSIQQGKLPH